MSAQTIKQALLDILEDEAHTLRSMVERENFNSYQAQDSIARLTVAVEAYSLEQRLAGLAQ